MTQHAPPEISIAYVGIEPTKKDRPRAHSITRNWAPWRVEFPLLDRLDQRKEILGFVHFKRQRLSSGSGVSWRSTVV
ncbi:hypothetical protein [Streptomyces albidochromogenes]|uniref:hypothetical protein n=1 Tax=Streptomyces albidochromogenes TaxID=329524 RepID=UPI00110F7AE4|nr:hypothetical protein [Streptomyces albidochromogenes]